MVRLVWFGKPFEFNKMVYRRPGASLIVYNLGPIAVVIRRNK